MATQISKTDSENKQPITVMAGMRPTGYLHLGHYLGVLTNWVALQQKHPCYFMVADWHALTTQADKNAENILDNTLEMVIDWLACGVDPDKAIIYRQSDLHEIPQLHLLLSMLTPSKWCETDPTLKEMVQNLSEELNYGLLGYPVLQTADILAVGGTHVPVGQDQLAHLEISRDIATRFNHVTKTALFAKPKPLLTSTPIVPGLDGRKMSKSYNNAIILKESPEETAKRLKGAVTDPARKLKTDAGTPENCVAVYPYYKLLADEATCNTVATECQQAQRGCMDCKMQLAEIINNQLAPIREKRKIFDTQFAKQVLTAGQQKAQQQAQPIITQAKKLMGLVSI